MGILNDRVAIVTGAGGGVGRGIAFALAKEGAATAVIDINAEGARQTVVAIEAAGGTGMALTCDIRESAAVDASVASVVERFGNVDILVNNANATHGGVAFEDISDADLELTFRTGPMATIFFMRACFPYLKDGYGRVINLRSGSELVGMRGFGAYIAGKGAIGGLSRVAAREWGSHGITVNCLAPSALSEAAAGYFDANPDVFEGIKASMSIPRFGDVESDIGRTAVFLAGPDASYVTGTTVSVDGAAAFYS